MSCFTESAKRYCLYTIDDKIGEIKIDKKKYSSHGLGYLLDPFAKTEEDLEKDWSPKVWKDILDFHYKLHANNFKKNMKASMQYLKFPYPSQG